VGHATKTFVRHEVWLASSPQFSSSEVDRARKGRRRSKESNMDVMDVIVKEMRRVLKMIQKMSKLPE
jgi:hypothetical protein